MSTFICPNCETSHSIFGSTKHFETLSKKIGVQILGEIPLEYKICEATDKGKPVTKLGFGSNDDVDPFGLIAERCLNALYKNVNM